MGTLCRVILFVSCLYARAIFATSTATAANVAPVTTASQASSSTPTPVCLQPRTSTEPAAAALESSIASDNSINKACDPRTQQTDFRPFTHSYYVLDNYYFFNSSLEDLDAKISSPTATPTSFPGNQVCIDNLNAIFSSCVTSQNFLGGWIEVNGLNYTINYSPLALSSSSGTRSSTGSLDTQSRDTKTGTASVTNNNPTNTNTAQNTATTASGAPASPSVYTFDGITLTAAASGVLVGDGMTIIPGSPPVTISGHTFSLGPQGSTLTVDLVPTPLTQGLVPTMTTGVGLTQTTSAGTAGPSLYTFDGITLTAGPTGVLIGDGTTILPGAAPVVIQSHTFSLAPQGISLAVDGSTAPLSQGLVVATGATGLGSITATSGTGFSGPQVYTFDGIAFTGGSAGLTAGILTITPGGAPATLSGHVFSLGAAGSSIIVDSVTSPLIGGIPIPITTAPSTAGPQVYTIAGITFIGGSRGLTAGSLTLTPGGASATLSGHIFSLPATGSSIIVDGVPTALPAPAAMTATLSTGSLGPQVYTLDGIPFTGGTAGLTAGTFSIAPGGPPVTLSGHIFSLPATGSSVVIDGKPTPLQIAPSTSSAAPGSTFTNTEPKPTGTDSQSTTTNSVIPPSSSTGTGISTAPAAVNAGATTTRSDTAATQTPGVSSGQVPTLFSTGPDGVPYPVPVNGPTAPPPVTITEPNGVVSVFGPTYWPYTDEITSTQTVIPSDVSFDEYYAGTGTSSTNFWLTTTDSHGSTTIVPVLVGCPGCGKGIIIWNFPTIPNIKISWPKFPKIKWPDLGDLKLPSFKFPCIPIPLIKKCDTPSDAPESGSDGDPDPPYPDGAPDPDPDDPDDPDETNAQKTDAKETEKKTDKNDKTTDKPQSTPGPQTTAPPDTTGTQTAATTNSACPLTKYTFILPTGVDLTTLTSGTGTESSLSGTFSAISTNSACGLTKYTFSLPPGTDLTTLTGGTGTEPLTGTETGSATSTGTNSACGLTKYTFSLPPGTDLTTLAGGTGTDTGTLTGTLTGTKTGSATSTGTNSACGLTQYTFSLPPGTDLTTLSGGTGTDTGTLTGTLTGTNTGTATATGTNSACGRSTYSFSLPPGTDLTTLTGGTGTDTGTGTITGTRSNTVTTAISITSMSSTRPATVTPTGTMINCNYVSINWYNPSEYCECYGDDIYELPLLPPIGTGSSTCDGYYAPIDTKRLIDPTSMSAGPTDIPGVNGLSGCAYNLANNDWGCPYVDYCYCAGPPAHNVGLTTYVTDGITTSDCNYSKQPTKDECPVNTASLNYIAMVSASEASVASVESASSASRNSAMIASTPTGNPVCYPAASKQDYDEDYKGYDPDYHFMIAAVNLLCGDECADHGADDCNTMTGVEFRDGSIGSVVKSFHCQALPPNVKDTDPLQKDQDFNCEPVGYGDGYGNWEAYGVMFQFGMKLNNKDCDWKIDSDTCKSLLMSMEFCDVKDSGDSNDDKDPLMWNAGAYNWNECVGFSLSAGGDPLTLDDLHGIALEEPSSKKKRGGGSARGKGHVNGSFTG